MGLSFSTGASDSVLFAVNRFSGTPYRSGTGRTRGAQVESGWITGSEINNPWDYLWRNSRKGDLVLWDYPLERLEPVFWAVTDSSQTVVDQFWESESPPDEMIRFTVSPLHVTPPYGGIPEGGKLTRVFLPVLSDLSTFELTVLNSPIPSWVSNSVYSEINDTGDLFNQLIVTKQSARELPVISRLNVLSLRLLDPPLYDMYIMIWLRSASQIIHDHRAETMIPLVKSNMNIDTFGVLSL